MRSTRLHTLLPTTLAATVFALLVAAPPKTARAAQEVPVPGPVSPETDARPLSDPFRPVCEIGPTFVTLQWWTDTPCPTRAEVRASNVPMTAWRPDGKKANLWTTAQSGVRVVNGGGDNKPTTYHRLRIDGLAPGTRYYYRVSDVGYAPTATEREWGAENGWRREYAVATQSGPGRKTIIRVPVKVLLMPNVVNVASARLPDGTEAPPPPPFSYEQMAVIRREYETTARFLFVNSGMRFYPDFHIFVDGRWQRWGDEPDNAQNAFYKNLPVSRSWAGKDYADPGGGTFTIVDTKNVTSVSNQPVYEELPYAGQIEQAFPRRWNPSQKTWEFYNSGGGTLGVDAFPNGVPGRSQFLGGGDTAWLAAHEFHHQMESEGQFSLSYREDDRITFDHPAPRTKENPWSTTGRHGSQWDVLGFWGRTQTSAQWLRTYFGEAISVADRDSDGVPDDDARVPLDEKRWGGDPKKFASDGVMRDLDKVMLSSWATATLQTSFVKPRMSVAVRPDPRKTDQDGDGVPDTSDPYPLYPYAPFVWPRTVSVDGDASDWAGVPLAGHRVASEDNLDVTFQQAHDEAFYYACFVVRGPWRTLDISLDGEGKGVFSGEGVQGIILERKRNAALTIAIGANGLPDVSAQTGPEQYTLRTAWSGAPGLVWKARPLPNNAGTVFEFALPNRGAGLWSWERGGREVGASVDITAQSGRAYPMYEPYKVFYARMLEGVGTPKLPATGAPSELTPDAAAKTLLPGDPALKFAGDPWTRDGAVLKTTASGEALAFVDGLNATEFDLWMRFEGRSDAILAAFPPSVAAASAGDGYVAFVGGYANMQTRLRLFGRETGEADARVTPGEHTMQLSRRNGAIWCLLDGKPILHASDPSPEKPIDRLAVIGGYNGAQVIREIRYRVGPASGR